MPSSQDIANDAAATFAAYPELVTKIDDGTTVPDGQLGFILRFGRAVSPSAVNRRRDLSQVIEVLPEREFTANGPNLPGDQFIKPEVWRQ